MSAPSVLCCAACERGVAPGCVVLQQSLSGRQVCCPHSLLTVSDRTYTARVASTGRFDVATGGYCGFCEEEGSVVLAFDELGWTACMRCIDVFHGELAALQCMGTNCTQPHWIALPVPTRRERSGRTRARLVCGDAPVDGPSMLSSAWRSLVVYDAGRSYASFRELFDPVGAVNAVTCSHAQQCIRALLKRLTLADVAEDDDDGYGSDGTSLMDVE